MAYGLSTRFVMANGVKTCYLDVGDKSPTLVALHGGGGGSSGVAGMGKLALRLRDDLRFIALDGVGGFGHTDPAAPTPYGSQSRVDHLSDFADTMCLDAMHLIGNSQGAWVAARYAIQRPDRVKSMVLIGSGTLGQSLGIPFLPSAGLAALQRFDGSRESMRLMMNELVYDPSSISEELIDARLASSSRPGAAESMKRFAEGNRFLEKDPVMVGNLDMRSTLPAVTERIPTLVLWGENDSFAPPETARKMEKILPHARFEYIKNAGHQLQTDQPDIVADLVRKHIASAG